MCFKFTPAWNSYLGFLVCLFVLCAVNVKKKYSYAKKSQMLTANSHPVFSIFSQSSSFNRFPAVHDLGTGLNVRHPVLNGLSNLTWVSLALHKNWLVDLFFSFFLFIKAIYLFMSLKLVIHTSHSNRVHCGLFVFVPFFSLAVAKKTLHAVQRKHAKVRCDARVGILHLWLSAVCLSAVDWFKNSHFMTNCCRAY